MLIHDGDEALIMTPFYNMGHLMNNDVFEALAGLLGELRVEADAPPPGGAAAPLRLHSLDKESADLDIHERLPLGN